MNIRKAFRVAQAQVAAMRWLGDVEAILEAENTRPGRPRTLKADQLFTMLVCMQITKRPPHLSGVATMFEDLDPLDRHELGLVSVSTHQVRYLFDRIAEALALDTEIDDNEPGKSSNANAVLQSLLNEFAATADPLIPTYARDVAIDGTRIPVPARAKAWIEKPGHDKKRARYADPDITFHTMANAGDRDPVYRSSQGYGATTIVTVGGDQGLPQTTAAFSVADMTMTYTQEGILGVPLIDTLARSSSLGAIYMDTGYSYHEDFRVAVRRNGLNPHMPLHPNHQGPHETWDGVVAAADVVLCPGTPETLLSIKGVSGDELSQLVAERSFYELRRHGRKFRPQGQRFTCPARAKKLRCPLYPQSLRLPTSIPTVVNPPKTHHKICAQETVTLPESMLTFLQDDPVGTDSHKARVRGRQTVESSYRQLKSLTSGGLTRDAIAVRGLVKFALLFAVIVVAENVRRVVAKIGDHLDESDDSLRRRFDWLDLTSPVVIGLRADDVGRSPPRANA